MKLLLLRLEGPMQSWGENAKWDAIRDTATMPTKSGIIGLLACCLGLSRDDPDIMNLSRSLNISVRADRAGEIRFDYHTVQGMPVINTADGGKRKKGSGIVTSRAYLEDASFFVVITGDTETLEKCAEALNNPVWPPYLGRKSCVPVLPILLQITDSFISVEDAIRNYPLTSRHDDIVSAQLDDTSGIYTRTDEPVSFKERRFIKRNVNYLSMNVGE